jgi:hypothetical protein
VNVIQGAHYGTDICEQKSTVQLVCFLLKSPLFPFLIIRDTCMLDCTLHY